MDGGKEALSHLLLSTLKDGGGLDGLQHSFHIAFPTLSGSLRVFRWSVCSRLVSTPAVFTTTTLVRL